MKMYYVANVRLPTKKAYGIQMAKMCEAFIEAGVDLELLIPRTSASLSCSVREFYHLRVDVPTKILPTVDRYSSGRIGYYISAKIFSLSCFVYLIIKRIRGERGVFYSIPDMFSLTAGLLAGMDCFLEIHEILLPAPLLWLLKYARSLIPTNAVIAESLRARSYSNVRIPEPNGVDLGMFANAPSKEEARRRLNLNPHTKIALYVGRFYEWKGLDVLVDAATLEPNIEWYVVGGGREEFMRVTARASLPKNLHIAGECKNDEVPIWLSSADALLILGTKKNEQSYRNTAPMKVYEYMAARRPIVASATPALRSIVKENEAVFYEPDSAKSLAETVAHVTKDNSSMALMIARAYQSAEQHTWAKRATRIVKDIQNFIE